MAKLAVLLLSVIASCLAFKVPHIDPNANWKVVGGEEAAPAQFPFAISLRYAGSHNCGGSLITDRWVLCAAHCVSGFDTKQITIVVGTNTLSSGGTEYAVEKTIAHQGYLNGQIGYDISLIKLASPVTLSEAVATIPLEQENLVEVDVTLCGWGRTSYPGNIPDKLQFVNLKTISVQSCKDQVGGGTNENDICTQMPAGQGACHGDSGGPLIHDGKVCGIVSRGYPCALGRPDMFTRVSAHLDWIKEQIDNN